MRITGQNPQDNRDAQSRLPLQSKMLEGNQAQGIWRVDCGFCVLRNKVRFGHKE